MANPNVHDLKGKRALVTGAAGLIGAPLVNQLTDNGAEVFGVDIRGDYYYADLNIFNNVRACINTFGPFDYVFHVAGMKGGVGIGKSSGWDFLTANVVPTVNLIKALIAAEFNGRFLYVSSVGAYGGDYQIFKEENALDGTPHSSDFYGGSAKRFGELLCKAAYEQHGLDYVVVRPTAVFGPHDRFDAKTSMVIPALIARLEAGENPLVLTGNPDTRRDFLYSYDAARGMIVAMQRGRIGEIYNLGTGATVAIRHVAQLLCEIYERKLVVQGSEDNAPSMRCMDMSKSYWELGFSATFSESQLLETIEGL